MRPTAKCQEHRKEIKMNSINTPSTNNTVRSTAAAYFYFDHIGQQIKGTELNFKKAGNPDSPQYDALMAAKELQPTYTYAPIVPKVKKQSYAGLNFELMMDYVEFKGSAVQQAEFAEIVDRNSTFPVIKSWFVENFKAGFTVEKAKREVEIAKRNTKKQIAAEALNKQKAAVRTVVKTRLAKATPSVVELPAVANFYWGATYDPHPSPRC